MDSGSSPPQEEPWRPSGACCDCEVFLDGWIVREDLLVPDQHGERD